MMLYQHKRPEDRRVALLEEEFGFRTAAYGYRGLGGAGMTFGAPMAFDVIERDVYPCAELSCRCGPCQPDDGPCPYHRHKLDVLDEDKTHALLTTEAQHAQDVLDMDAIAWWEARYDHKHGTKGEYYSGWQRLGKPTGPAHAFKPRLGMGATFIAGNDRYPYTIVGIESDTRIVVRRCHFDTLEDLGPEWSGLYGFTRTLTLRHDGQWREKASGSPFIIGVREAHQPREV